MILAKLLLSKRLNGSERAPELKTCHSFEKEMDLFHYCFDSKQSLRKYQFLNMGPPSAVWLVKLIKTYPCVANSILQPLPVARFRPFCPD